MDAFIGEVRAFAIGYVPQGWLACAGQTLSVGQYAALYSLIGNQYGGTAGQNFVLPNLNGTVLIGQGQLQGGLNYPSFSHGGTGAVGLNTTTIPPHTHDFNVGTIAPGAFVTNGVNQPDSTCYISNVLEKVGGKNDAGFNYVNTAPSLPLNSNVITPFIGGVATHSNYQPYLVIIYCVCNEGEYPVRD